MMLYNTGHLMGKSPLNASIFSWINPFIHEDGKSIVATYTTFSFSFIPSQQSGTHLVTRLSAPVGWSDLIAAINRPVP